MSTRFNVGDAAKYTKLSVSFLNKKRVFGGGPIYSRLGRRVVYEQADLDAWLNNNKFASTSEYRDGGAL